MGSRRASGGAGEQDTGLVVGGISVSPASTFDLLDAGVRCFGASVGDAGPDEHLDGEPPGLDGVPEPPGLVHVGGDHVAAQDHLLSVVAVSLKKKEKSAELFFDAPGRRQLLGGVVDGEDVIEAGPGPGRQRVVAAEQKGSVRPGRVDLAAAALLTVADQPLPHVTYVVVARVTIRFASCTRWNGSTLTS